MFRNYFIPRDNFLCFKYLPKGNYHLKIEYGKDWAADINTTQFIYEGNFDSVMVYAVLKNATIKINQNNLTAKDTSLFELLPVDKIPAAWRVSNFDFFYKH